jgi:hypothetical protein
MHCSIQGRVVLRANAAKSYTSLPEAVSQVKTHLFFRDSFSRESENFEDLSPRATWIDSETLFNGAISAASVDHVPNSLRLSPRGDIMRLSTGRRAPRFMPPQQGGARRPPFGES